MLYVITGYEFSVKGRSRPNALLHKLIEYGEFREGEIITGKANLEKYIGDVTQIYINQRVLKNNVEVSYSTGERNEDGTIPVTIITKVEDTWNIIALPRPSYKENRFFDLTIKARDYNFLGSMNPLRIDIGYNYNIEKQQNSFMLGVYSNTPFKALGYYWNLNFDNTAQYRIDAPFYYQNTTGLSMELPFHSTTFTFGFDERFFLNEESPDWAQDVGYDQYQNMYMSSRLYVYWKIPTGLTVSRFGELSYTPVISAVFNHEFSQQPLGDFLKGPFLNFSHTLGFEKIDWHANYREGLSVSVGNSNQFDFNNTFNDISFNVTGIGHYIVSDFFAVSSRLMYQFWHFSSGLREGEYAGYYLRGIADKSITAYQMFLLNLDFPFRLFVFTPSKWLNNRKLSFFDFEMQASPIIDLAVYYQESFQLAATGGVEFMVFPAFMRNLYLRIGLAVNLKELFTARPVKLPGNDDREFYIYMGHFY